MLIMSISRNSPVVFCAGHLVVWVTVLIACSRCQDYSVKTCLAATEDAPTVNVTLTCPEGRVISLGEVVSSVNRYGYCINALGDCTDTTDVFNPCQRQRECTVTLNRTYSPICTAYATQLKVYYVCELVPTLTTSSSPVTVTPSSPVTVMPSSPVTVTPSRVMELATVSSRRTQYDQPGPGPTQEDNTGLIAGCVVAVVVTVILLIIAIIMVVRRLACAPSVPEAEDGKNSGCEILPCVTATEDEKNSKFQPGSADRKTDNPSKRNWKWRPRHTDKNQNMSARLAPVGQEDEGTGSTATPGTLQENRRSMPDPNKDVVASMDAVKVMTFDLGSESAGGEVAAYGTDGRAAGREQRPPEVWKRANGGVKRKSREVPLAQDPDNDITSLGGASTAHSAPPSKSARTALAGKSGTWQGAHTPLTRFDAVAVPNTETSTSC